MQIFVAADHRGFDLKNKIVAFLARAPFTASAPVSVVDLGPKYYDKNDDFNDPARAVARSVLTAEKLAGRSARPSIGDPQDRDIFGILICGSAVGVAIQANRFKGIRAATAADLETAFSARNDDDTNVLCLSANHLAAAADPLETEAGFEDLQAIIEKFLTTPFSGEARYVRRIKRLDEEIN